MDESSPTDAPLSRRTLSAWAPASAAPAVCASAARSPATLRTPRASTSAPSASVATSRRRSSGRLHTVWHRGAYRHVQVLGLPGPADCMNLVLVRRSRLCSPSLPRRQVWQRSARAPLRTHRSAHLGGGASLLSARAPRSLAHREAAAAATAWQASRVARAAASRTPGGASDATRAASTAANALGVAPEGGKRHMRKALLLYQA